MLHLPHKALVPLMHLLHQRDRALQVGYPRCSRAVVRLFIPLKEKEEFPLLACIPSYWRQGCEPFSVRSTRKRTRLDMGCVYAFDEIRIWAGHLTDRCHQKWHLFPFLDLGMRGSSLINGTISSLSMDTARVTRVGLVRSNKCIMQISFHQPLTLCT